MDLTFINNDILIAALFFIIWFITMRFILPRMGVST